jgi:hypothetical protein
VGSIPVGAPRMLLWKKLICMAEWIFPENQPLHCLFRCLSHMHREERTFHLCIVENLVIVCGRAMIHLLDNPTINVITALQQQQQQQQQQG